MKLFPINKHLSLHVLEGEVEDIMDPQEFLNAHPKCNHIQHATGWFTRRGIETLLENYPMLRDVSLGFRVIVPSIPYIGGEYRAVLYVREVSPAAGH